MPRSGPRFSKDEFARRGQETYTRAVLPHLQGGDQGTFVALDIEAGAYEVDHDDFMATERLLARRPHAQIWLVRVGRHAAYRLAPSRSPFPRREGGWGVRCAPYTPASRRSPRAWSSWPASSAGWFVGCRQA